MKLFAFVMGLPALDVSLHLAKLLPFFINEMETLNQDLILQHIQRHGIEPSPLNAPYIYYAVSSLINNNAPLSKRTHKNWCLNAKNLKSFIIIVFYWNFYYYRCYCCFGYLLPYCCCSRSRLSEISLKCSLLHSYYHQHTSSYIFTELFNFFTVFFLKWIFQSTLCLKCSAIINAFFPLSRDTNPHTPFKRSGLFQPNNDFRSFRSRHSCFWNAISKSNFHLFKSCLVN